MAIVERNENRLVLQAGGGLSAFTLTLDKPAKLARIERSTLMWKRRPRELPLSAIKAVEVASFRDTASGAEVRQLMLRTQADEAVVVPVAETALDETASALRGFLGLAA